MLYPLLPWVRDVCEVQLDIYLAQRRVSSNHATYLKTYFKSVVSDIINEGKMKNARTGKTTNQPPLVWANTSLTAEHIDTFTGQERTDSEILNGVLALVGDGCELVLKHDSSSQCWRAYLFNKAPDLPVHHGLSCFADTPRNTIDLLLYKFFIVLGGEWPEASPETAKPKFG